jgi:hypothetical protein
MIENNKARAAEALPAQLLRLIAPNTANKIDYGKRLVQLDCTRRRRAIDRTDSTLLVAHELAEPLGIAVLCIFESLSSYPKRVAPLLAGITDVYQIEDRLREVTDADLAHLNACEYLADDDIPKAARNVIEESLRDCQPIAAPERASFAQLVELVCRRTARLIGQRIIERASRSEQQSEVE